MSGALTELIYARNWQQQGAVTVTEAITAMQTMIDAYYDGCSDCDPCTLPGGGKIIRINPDDGHVEELGDDGTWQPPNGDYAITPPAAREGSDPICLAATNASNVYSQIYESLSDSFSGHLGEGAAYIAMATAFAALVQPEFAPITVAIGAFFLSVFGILYKVVEFWTADLWDANFTKAFVCVLTSCATNEDGVITFDFNCVGQALYAQVNLFDISELQLRLFIQLTYIIQMTGGSDGLSAAGATTAITEADCDYCEPDCEQAFGGDGQNGWTAGQYVPGFDPTVYDAGTDAMVGGRDADPYTGYAQVFCWKSVTAIMTIQIIRFADNCAGAEGVYLFVDGDLYADYTLDSSVDGETTTYNLVNTGAPITGNLTVGISFAEDGIQPVDATVNITKLQVCQ